MSYNVTLKACCVRAVAVFVLLGALVAPLAAEADPPTPLNVLFVANGYYTQETQIYNHLIGLGFTVTQVKDYKVKGTTNLAPYDLIIVTEFAPNIPTSGINNIKASGKPLLIVEYWDFWYSYRFGLTKTDNCGYVGGVEVEAIDVQKAGDLFGIYNDKVTVYTSSYTIYGIEQSNIEAGVTPVYFSSSSFNEVAVLYDEARKIISTGIYDTTRYTAHSWMLFDRFLGALVQQSPPWINDGELWAAYEDSGLRAYLAEVKRTPQNHTPESIAAEVWRRMFTWQLEPLAGFILAELTCQPCHEAATILGPFLVLFLTDPSDSSDHNVRRTRDPLTVWTPETCGDTTNTDYCAEDRWFMGRNRGANYDDYITYAFDEVVRGTDLGISVQFGEGGRTFFYMGDTSDIDPPEKGPWGTPSMLDCAQGYNFACDDAIAVSYNETENNDIDETDGIDAHVYYQYFNDGTGVVPGFKPLIIPGVNQDEEISGLPELGLCDTEAPPCLGLFNVPTGAAFVEWEMEMPSPAISVPTIALWYATAANIYGKSRSWLAFSGNGTNFGPLNGQPPGVSPYGVFSDDKFIQVSPVTITQEDLYALCHDPSTESSILCELPHLQDSMEMSNDGMLLFGAGQRYRCSPLYLGFMTIPRLNVWYYHEDGGTVTWVTDESLATPISPINEADCTANCDDATGDWIYGGSADDQKQVFGEISVKLVKGATPDEHYLVMLSNHSGDVPRVQYRTAPLFQPDTFSAPEPTTARGYGPYIVDAYTRVEGGQLIMYHFVSAWNGKWEDHYLGWGEPYGVYSRPVELESTYDFPEWPPL